MTEKVSENNVWHKTTECTPPELDGAYLVVYRGFIRILYWNTYYEVWDDEDGDDFECHYKDVEYWMELPDLPK